MEYAIKYWGENTDFEELRKQIGDKKIVVWGAYVNGKHVRKILSEKGLEVSFYIDGHKASYEYDNLLIRKPSEEIEENIYVFIAVIGVRDEIAQYLNAWHMKEGNDYTYISKALPSVVISECAGGYKDCNGNRLEFEDDRIKCKIEFKGFNSRIKIGKRFSAIGAKISVESGSEVSIGDYVTLGENTVVEVSTEGKIEIGDNCLCYKDSQMIVSEKGGRVEFGNYVTMGERFFCVNTSKYGISIGNDCMFSHDVSIILGGHSIFDLETKENILINGQKHIKIGDHVWLGKNAVILDNAEIGRGCIVGASSVVKLKSEQNCVIAGNPAKVIKSNHCWDRRHNIEFSDV